MRRILGLTVTCLALGLSACSGDDSDTDSGLPPADGGVTPNDAGTEGDAGSVVDMGSGVPDAGPADASEAMDGGEMDGGAPGDPACDPLQPAVCAFPWPSNLYLEEDLDRTTGYTLTFGDTTLPANTAGAHVDPGPYRRLDGYGPGTPIMVRFPNLDASGLPDETDIGASVEADASILLFRATGKGLERVPYFAELDANEDDPAVRVLFIRPAVILDEDARYIVALRDLVDTGGDPYAPSAAFEALRSGDTTGDPLLSPRQGRFDDILALLAGAGVDTGGLQLAWDFHTASSDALHGAMLHMRDEGLATIDANPPQLTVTSTTEFAATNDGTGRPVDENVAYEVEGTLTVPSYLADKQITAFSSTVLNRDADGVPQQNGTRTIQWWMLIPHSALTGTAAVDLVEYGHGLLGSGDQVFNGYNRPVAQDNRFILFGADLTGFRGDFQMSVGVALINMSAFEWIAETIHQGLLEYLMLGRTMLLNADGWSFFDDLGIDPNTDELFYSGISQGGIFGGTYMALSTDVINGHLGVPGNNYSTLLSRSVDFTPFFEMLKQSYPDTTDQALLLATVQNIWDMTDPVTYMRHIVAEPFPNTPAHRVLLAPAKGDYQVAVITNEIVARTRIGIPLMENYDDERTVWGVTYASYPRQGSGVVLWDFGNPWPPAGNLPPMDGLGDPHGLPRRNANHIRQLGHFLETGEIIDVCGGDGCNPD